LKTDGVTPATVIVWLALKPDEPAVTMTYEPGWEHDVRFEYVFAATTEAHVAIEEIFAVVGACPFGIGVATIWRVSG